MAEISINERFKSVQINKIRVNFEKNTFEVYNSDNANYFASIEYPHKMPENIEDTKYKIENNKVYHFYKKDESESLIFSITEKKLYGKKPIGIILQIKSLISIDHNFATKNYFLDYAFVAFQLLILDSKFVFKSNKKYKLINIIESFNIVLIVSEIFNINEYLPCLFEYGYYKQEVDKNFKSLKASKEITSNLNLKPISKSLIDESYIIDIFQTLIFEQHPLIKFHVLYQIIELLIHKISICEVSKISERLKSKSLLTRELQDEIKQFSSEKDRLNILMQDYSSNLNLKYKQELEKYCHKLIIDVKSHSKNDNDIKVLKNNIDRKDLITSLYEIRNLVVHDFRSFNLEKFEFLKELNIHFELFIIDLLINYKEI